MSLLHDLLFLLGLRRDSALRSYRMEEQLHIRIVELAQQEQLSEEEIHAGLLAAALAQHHSTRSLWGRWHSLSPHEQEVTALICLGYTNNEMAVRLGISHTTIKTHIRNILVTHGAEGCVPGDDHSPGSGSHSRVATG